MAQGNVARVKNRWKEYFYLGFYTLGVIKLAENYQEWRRALKQLAENTAYSQKHQCYKGYSSSRKTHPSP
jgi:hypothetical protein